MTKLTAITLLTKLRNRRVHLKFIMLLFFLLLCTAGQFLSYTESPRKSDVIIVLSGGTGRVEKAVQLYTEDFASYIIMTKYDVKSELSGDMIQTALALGIPKEALLRESSAQSTYQNAEFTLPIMKKNGFNSATIVSSDFHMRRVMFIFDNVYKNEGIELTYVGAESGYNAMWWWSDRYSREMTFNEYVKLIGNAFGYNGREAKRALEKLKNWFH